MATFKDHFSGHADDYRRYRPAYPCALFDHLTAVAPGRRLAWDCGTGNGQAAGELATRFRRVIATDASPEQILQSRPSTNVTIATALAEAFSMQIQWGLPALLGYFRSWSAVRRYIAHHGHDPVAPIDPPLSAAWGEGSRVVRWPLSVVVGEITSTTP